MLAQNCDANNKHGLWLMSRINKYDGESFTTDSTYSLDRLPILLSISVCLLFGSMRYGPSCWVYM